MSAPTAITPSPSRRPTAPRRSRRRCRATCPAGRSRCRRPRRPGHTARVMFLLPHAPPHLQHLGRTMAAADRPRRQGSAIYPVACSGYKDDAEVVLRSLSMLTGTQFLFLTDDSGVGNSHAEPHIPFYHVQKLDQMMIRMIAGELSGKRLEPEASQIIRTVGKPIN